MKVFVTGANGFLGRKIASQAVAAGHEVTALVRPRRVVETGAFEPSVTVVRGDLRSPGEWTALLRATDVVVHAAAAAGGERSLQLANTVVATERLLEALDPARLTRFVHVSSLSVYDFQSLPVGARLDENSPLERRPHERDAYTETKIMQERLVRQWCSERGVACVLVRPGAVVGPGKPWGYGAAFAIGRFAFVAAPRAAFRIVSVSNCAAAIVSAVELESDGIETINLVDDDPPTHAEYFRLCRLAGAPARMLVPVPWLLLDWVGRALQTTNRRLLGGRLRTPELLDHRRQEARWKPLRYPNDRARKVLGWQPVQRLDEIVELAVDSGRPVRRG